MLRIFHPFSADPQQIRGSMLELLSCSNTTAGFLGVSSPSATDPSLFAHASFARLPDYPVGIVWESSGVVLGLSSSIGKGDPPREPGGRVFEVFTESPLSVPLGTLVSTLLRAVGSPTRPTDGRSAVRSMKAVSVPLATDSHTPIVCMISDCTRTKCAQLHWIVNLETFCVGIAVPDE
jgi:hypothetical protein